MSVLTVHIEDHASPAVAAQMRALQDRTPLHQAMGKRVAVLLQGHFKALQSRGNKNHWPSRYFWHGRQGVAQRTAMTQADPTGATVTIADGRFGTHLFGATITPKRGKFLAIPARAEAYAASVKGRIRDVFPNLRVAYGRGGPFGLIEADATNIGFRKRNDRSVKAERRKDRAGRWETGGLLMFWLCKKAVVPAKPDALPPVAQIAAAMMAEAERYLIDREAEAQGGAAA